MFSFALLRHREYTCVSPWEYPLPPHVSTPGIACERRRPEMQTTRARVLFSWYCEYQSEGVKLINHDIFFNQLTTLERGRNRGDIFLTLSAISADHQCKGRETSLIRCSHRARKSPRNVRAKSLDESRVSCPQASRGNLFLHLTRRSRLD